ncbi:MAG: PEP-CTERM sorting domain-containing protein [Rubrivivax sp.]|nr:MAG: PEP-CTERM sorting domain-containing protein [Rubrivivax sp.]
MSKPLQRIFVGAACALLSLGAWAAPDSWGGSGEAPATASFVAASSGQLVAYYTGFSGGYVNSIGVRVNGGADSAPGLDNRSAYGASLVLGNVMAGDTLVFFIDANSGAARYYTDPTLNHDGLGGASVNHAWATAYAGDSLVPAGTHIAFEDLPGGGDFNYRDHGFVFEITAVPEPASWALMLFGAAGLAALRRRR